MCIHVHEYMGVYYTHMYVKDKKKDEVEKKKKDKLLLGVQCIISSDSHRQELKYCIIS